MVSGLERELQLHFDMILKGGDEVKSFKMIYLSITNRLSENAKSQKFRC